MQTWGAWGRFRALRLLRCMASGGGLIAAMAMGESAAEPPDGRAASLSSPNVVFVLTDDQGYGDLGCHGNPVLKTPGIDKLHSQSVRFLDFHATPLCTTTRAALMTGRASLRTGAWSVLNGRSLLRRDELTMAEAFAANGYRTALFGKWHLGDSFPFRPQDRGFDESVIHGGGGIGTTPDFWGNDYFDDTYFRNGLAEKFPGYGTDALFAEALAFIEKNRDRPFYCQISTAAPHDPFNVDEKYAAPYRGLVPDGTANFYGMIANIDENVERLAKRLDTLGLSENTILVFMTDNGSSGGWKAYNAGMRGNKGSAYEGGHRVPFFIRWPAGNIGPARDVPNLASATDLLPTFVDLCELRLPRPVDFDGLSLAPLLRGKGEPPADRVVISGTQPNGPPVPHHNTAVMRGPWRLVNGKELYDISNDPAQERDESKRHPEIVAELQAAHDAWWRDVEPSFSDTPRIVLGDPRANPTWLTSWDLHGQSVYMQNQIEYGERADGYWEIEVASAGIYEIALRRWPAELDRPLNEGLQAQRIGKKGDQPSSVVKGANRARLCIAGLDLEQDIPLQAREAVFRVELPAGPARMQAWFVNTSTLGGATWGVYYARAAKE